MYATEADVAFRMRSPHLVPHWNAPSFRPPPGWTQPLPEIFAESL